MASDPNKIRALHISPGGPPPLDKPLPWNFHNPFLEIFSHFYGKEAHIDSREPLEGNWWEAYQDILRLEIHGDLPGGFDAVRHFTELVELVIYDSPSLKCLEFLRELKVLVKLRLIRCPALADVGPIVDLKLEQDHLQGNYSGDCLEAVCITGCALRELSPFARMGWLEELNLRENRITDVSPLASCRIPFLDLSRNQIEDIRPIYPLIRSGGEIYLNDNHIRDISGLTADMDEERREVYYTLKLWLGNNEIPREQLRENEDYIRDIGPEDISPAKREWVEKRYDVFMREYNNVRFEHGEGSRTTVRYTARSLRDCDELERYPSYSIRGKPVSPETAREIIRKTDGYLYELAYDKPGRGHLSDSIHEIFARHGVKPAYRSRTGIYPMHWIAPSGELHFGWCHPDGYIGIDYYSRMSCPFLSGMLDDWMFIMDNITTELDIVVGVTAMGDAFDPNRPIADQLYSGYHIKGIPSPCWTRRRPKSCTGNMTKHTETTSFGAP